MAEDEYQVVEDRNGKWIRLGWNGSRISRVQIAWKLNDQAAEIRRLKAELAGAVNCPDCNGRGRRWYSLYGDANCDLCSGSGKRR